MLEKQEETQEDIAEEEEKQPFILEDIGTIVTGFKTLIYAYMCFMAAFSVLGITWKHKYPPATQTPPPIHIPPAKEPKGPNIFKGKSGPFEM